MTEFAKQMKLKGYLKMNTLLLKITSPIIRSHVRAWLLSAMTYLVLYVLACVSNQTPSVQHLVIWVLTALQGTFPALVGIVTNGQIQPDKLAAIVWLLLSVTILPALLRIPWIQKNQLAAEIITDAEQVAESSPAISTAPALPLPAAPAAQANPESPLKQP